jgi:hypothetical protein
MKRHNSHMTRSYRRLSTMTENECKSNSEDSPVCPPMWNCPEETVTTVPIFSRKDTMPLFDVILPRRPAARPRPTLPATPTVPSRPPSSSNVPIPGRANNDDRMPPYCRSCGPEIPGVIGVPDPNNGPWPAQTDGVENYPFIPEDASPARWGMMADGTLTFRSAGTYSGVPYTVWSNVVRTTTNLEIPRIHPNEPPITTISLFNSSNFPQRGTVFIGKEQFTYTGKNDATNTLTGVTRGLGPNDGHSGLAGWYPGIIRGSDVVLFPDSNELQNNSASFVVTVEPSQSINVASSNWTFANSPGLTLSNADTARGRDFINNSYIRIMNRDLGGSNGSGCIYFRIRTTTWPDKDVSTCVIRDSDNPYNTSTYCCSTNFLTPNGWSTGADRCIASAAYEIPETLGDRHAQRCPPGFVYDPQSRSDGLPCRKCENNTTTWNPAQLADSADWRNQPPCTTTGVGCQKCCNEILEGGGRAQC